MSHLKAEVKNEWILTSATLLCLGGVDVSTAFYPVLSFGVGGLP